MTHCTPLRRPASAAAITAALALGVALLASCSSADTPTEAPAAPAANADPGAVAITLEALDRNAVVFADTASECPTYDEYDIAAVITLESNWDPELTTPVGGMPLTGMPRSLWAEYGAPEANPVEEGAAIRATTKYLCDMANKVIAGLDAGAIAVDTGDNADVHRLGLAAVSIGYANLSGGIEPIIEHGDEYATNVTTLAADTRATN